MNQALRKDAQQILASSLQAVLPDEAVQRALRDFEPHGGRVLLVAAGKAAWQMAAAAVRTLGRVDGGVVVTKYHHVKGDIPGVVCCEGGHPVPDEGSFAATQKALELMQDLTAADDVLFLLSGGGSALFEKPLVPGAELQDITGQLLGCGADIVEMNTIRKRLSAVKGGRFAQLCAPARVYSIVLSDILGDPLDMIASGPAYPDSSTCAQALAVAEKYGLHLTDQMRQLLGEETPKQLDNVETVITGSVRILCAAAAESCEKLGYQATVLTDQLCCQAREAGSFLASIALTHKDTDKPLAFIAGGETVVRLTGTGKGGRNQELALAAAPGYPRQTPRLVSCYALFLPGVRRHRRPHQRRGRTGGRLHPGPAGRAGGVHPRGAPGQRRLSRPGAGGRPDPDRPHRHQRERRGRGAAGKGRVNKNRRNGPVLEHAPKWGHFLPEISACIFRRIGFSNLLSHAILLDNETEGGVRRADVQHQRDL